MNQCTISVGNKMDFVGVGDAFACEVVAVVAVDTFVVEDTQALCQGAERQNAAAFEEASADRPAVEEGINCLPLAAACESSEQDCFESGSVDRHPAWGWDLIELQCC